MENRKPLTKTARRARGARTVTPLASYRLGRIALDQRQFSVAELAALAQVPANTVYSFIAGLGNRVTSKNVPGSFGRPPKLYSLTPEGVEYLLERNLEIARASRGVSPEPVSVPNLPSAATRRPAPGVQSATTTRAKNQAPRIASGPLHELFTKVLKDLYTAETLTKVGLTLMIKAASSDAVKRAFERHLDATSRQVDRLQRIGQELELKLAGQKSAAMQGLVEESRRLIAATGDNEALDAGLICSAQKVGHYQIAAYGTATKHAEVLGYRAAAKLLQQTLNEETGANKQLAALADTVLQGAAEAIAQQG